MSFCPAQALVTQGMLEAHLICLKEKGHDGYHDDPGWGIWEEPQGEY